MKVASLLEYGRKRANPLAEATNNIRLAESDLTDDTVGRDYLSANVAAARSVVSAVVDGTTYALVSSLDDLEDNLITFMRRFEADPIFVEASYAGGGGALAVEHIGATTLDKLIFDDASEHDLVRQTTVTITHEYRIDIEANDDADLVIGATTGAIDVPATISGQAATLVTEIDTDMGAATVETTIVTEDLVSTPNVFKVRIFVDATAGVPTYDGVAMTYVKRDIEEVFS